jgi:micrococcal nuclease
MVNDFINPVCPSDTEEQSKRGVLDYVWLQDGQILNEEIVRAGDASLKTIPPDVQYQQRFQEAFREAQEARRGLGKIKEP